MHLDRTTGTAGIAGLVFIGFATLTTQVDALGSELPFTVDPYDAVTWFALIALGIVGGATVIRWLAHLRGAADVAVERRIRFGAALVAGIAAIGVASDLVALAVAGVQTFDGGVGLALVLLAFTIVAVAVAVVDLWQGRASLFGRLPQVGDEPDLIDDLGVIAGSLGARVLATRALRWTETSRFSPRRHRLLVGLVGGGLAGLGAIVWHAFREGAWASPVAAAVFGGLMAIGVIAAYLVGLEPLRIIRTSSVRSRTNSPHAR